MTYIIDGKKFDDTTSEQLYAGGDGQSLSRDCGRLEVYRSPKGTLWARLYYWPSEVRDSETLVAGDEPVRRLIQRGSRSCRSASILEKVFGPVEEG